MKSLLPALALFTGLTCALPACAQFQKSEDAIKYRQGAFRVMAEHFGRIGAMANGRVPFDAKVAQENMALVDALHGLPFSAFDAGSDKGAPNRARPEVWKDAAKFKAARDKLDGEMSKLAAAVKGGDLGAIKTAFGATGGACKGCHDDFRAKDYSAN
ncbi:MAG TPA: cytochrome c [Rubrivivax sp.]|nr:cytochrome c [Burkholderiales bacterium]HNT39576.1 cytochrome c [Rubrivivax sp.]